MGLLSQVYVLVHRDRSCKPSFVARLVTVYWHRADQSQAPGREATGVPIFKSLVWLYLEKNPRESNPGMLLSKQTPLAPGQRGGFAGEGVEGWGGGGGGGGGG